MADVSDIRETVRERYARAATQAARGALDRPLASEAEAGCCGPGGCPDPPIGDGVAFGGVLNLEQLPLADESVDVVISNCVINLSGDKPRVIREAARVLRRGGRLAVSDVIADPDIDDATRADVAACCEPTTMGFRPQLCEIQRLALVAAAVRRRPDNWLPAGNSAAWRQIAAVCRALGCRTRWPRSTEQATLSVSRRRVSRLTCRGEPELGRLA